MAIEIVDLPINSMVIFHSYVNLPEGSTQGAACPRPHDIPAMRGAIWILGAVERIAPKFELETNMANLSFQRQILYKSGIF